MLIQKQKRAQMHIPFQIILSLILIAVFLFVAFFVIRQFLEIHHCSEIGLFVQDLKDSVNDVWQAQEASTSTELSLPSSIKYVCFANLSSQIDLADVSRDNVEDFERIFNNLRVYFKYRQSNFFFYPWQSSCEMPSHKIEHISLKGLSNPYCFKNTEGKIKIRFIKSFDDIMVGIR